MNKEFRKLLTKSFQGLTYISETDAPFEVESGENDTVREVKFNDFFAPLILKKQGMSREEQVKAERFKRIKGLIEANTSRRRVYLIGKIEIDVYIFARDLSGSLLVIKTSKLNLE